MPDDSGNAHSATDEQLIEAYYAGKEDAFDLLFNRYYTRCLGFLFHKSIFKKDVNYLEDIRSEIIRTTISKVRDKSFKVEGVGSFAAWFYKVAFLKCLNADKKRRKSDPNLSAACPDSRGPFPDDKILSMVHSNAADIPAMRRRLVNIFKGLPEEDKKLLILSVEMPYGEIIKKPEYSKYNVHSLTEHLYNIRKKIRTKQ